MLLYDTHNANWEDAYATVLQELHSEEFRAAARFITRPSHQDRRSRRRLLVGLNQASVGVDEEQLECTPRAETHHDRSGQ